MNEMSPLNSPLGGVEAELRYLSSDFEVVHAGDYVVCAITGQRIALDDLRYWSHLRQEAYIDAAASLEAWKRANKG